LAAAGGAHAGAAGARTRSWWLAFHEGHIAGMCGDSVKAGELGARAAQLGRRFDVPDLEMLRPRPPGGQPRRFRSGRGGHVLPGRGHGDGPGGRGHDPHLKRLDLLFLVSACTAVLDYERAFEWCDRIAEFVERYGSRYMLAFCRAEYGAVHPWRGRWADAETLLEAELRRRRGARRARGGCLGAHPRAWQADFFGVLAPYAPPPPQGGLPPLLLGERGACAGAVRRAGCVAGDDPPTARGEGRQPAREPRAIRRSRGAPLRVPARGCRQARRVAEVNQGHEATPEEFIASGTRSRRSSAGRAGRRWRSCAPGPAHSRTLRP
jgi:hypothetical protein